MANKTEIKNIKGEIRELKKALTSRQKQTTRDVKAKRDVIRAAEREIERITLEATRFEADTNVRLAILEGRLLS